MTSLVHLLLPPETLTHALVRRSLVVLGSVCRLALAWADLVIDRDDECFAIGTECDDVAG